MTEDFFLDVISGRRGGLTGRALRCLLRTMEPVYHLITWGRNAAYDAEILKSESFSVPIISVGNLTTGGTGKTPTVAWLIHWLQSQHLQPAIVSRGYRQLDEEANDEKRLLDELCPGVPHVQNRHRAAAIQSVTNLQVQGTDKSTVIHPGSKPFQADVIVLDDGFQHRRVQRDFDLVLVDALNPWGYHHLLPRGLLREARSGLKRAQHVLITRSDLVSEGHLQQIQADIAQHTAAPISVTRFEPTGLVTRRGERLPLSMLNEHPLIAFAGIGNPEGFRRTLEALGVQDLVPGNFLVFPDHHHYGPGDFERIAHTAHARQARLVVTTRKDLVKCQSAELPNCELCAVEIGLRFVTPQSVLEQQLCELGLCRANNSL